VSLFPPEKKGLRREKKARPGEARNTKGLWDGGKKRKGIRLGGI